MKTISNKEFEEALNNINYKNIINTASRPFRKIPPDELKSCQLIGLWKAMLKYNINRAGFLTYLYNMIRWECLKFLDKEKSIRTTDYFVKREKQNDLLLGLPEKHKNILYQRFYMGMTYKEIGQANEYSGETARNRVRKAVEYCRKIEK